MRDGFIKVAAGIPRLCLANPECNAQNIKNVISKADKSSVNLLVLPELCITGYTCGDLFSTKTLLKGSLKALEEITEFTKDKYPIVIVGMPIKYRSKLYNCAVVIKNGDILGVIPKTFIANHNGFEEKRQFESSLNLPKNLFIDLCSQEVPFGTDLLFSHNELSEYAFAVEICEDLFSADQTSQILALNGANIIANLSASNEIVGKEEYRRNLISVTSKRLLCGYVFSSSGTEESTQDTIFSAHSMIFENGELLSENKPFEKNDIIISEIDVEKLSHKRQNNTSFVTRNEFKNIVFKQDIKTTDITKKIKKNPFVPETEEELNKTAETILNIQSHALARRLAHTHSRSAVIGISGGLDSTLALLVATRAMKILGRLVSDITAITMPCFGTTSRTRTNSEKLCSLLGVSFKEINIKKAVKQHFSDIGQSETCFDVTYENSQARERTQVLMDVANKENGLVVGTGDLSELALGWATYNGDHMSMYGVNASVPKTLVRSLVRFEAENSPEELKAVLLDILDTPVSPELLPADENDNLTQKTEDLVGPYELHDFFLYHLLHLGETPKKIFRLAKLVFPEYNDETILHWLTVFTRRFFNQQFKRSCLPDGAKVGSISLSPRGDLKMPTDALSDIWLSELKELKS